MTKRRSLRGILVGFGLLATAAGAFAQEPFYKGKSVRIIVGGSAGGGYDTYTRAIARHLSKHVPGNPTFVVENMTGAGSLIAANHTYKVARPDGLTIATSLAGSSSSTCLENRGSNSTEGNSSTSACRPKTPRPSASPK